MNERNICGPIFEVIEILFTTRVIIAVTSHPRLGVNIAKFGFFVDENLWNLSDFFFFEKS